MGVIKLDVAKARQLRESGMTFRAIGAALGVTHAAIIFAIKNPKRGCATPPKQGRPRGSVERPKSTVDVERDNVEVPAWAVGAGLEEEYRELAITKDEFFAASHCRSLVREMRRGA